MKHAFFILLLLTNLSLTAQLPTDFRSEQIYLNLQQNTYLPGDTLLLEGQVTCLTGERFLPYSNYLYIECFNDEDSILVRQKLSCKENGYFSTHLISEYEWQPGVYYLRAYTRLMQNFSTESFAQQPFLLAKEFPTKEESVYEARCAIVPSGGKFIANYPQTVAIYLTDECTFPIAAKLQLTSESGDTLGIVQTSESGMAQLKFIPALGINYYLTGNIDNKIYRFPLPKATKDIKIQGNLNGKRLSYQILNAPKDEKFLYTYDRSNGLTCTNIKRDNGILILNEAPEIVTLFLTDADTCILAEYTLAGKLKRNKRIQAPDTVKLHETIHYELSQVPNKSRVMARVVADNDLLATTGEQTLKYLSDYASSIPFPHHLYASDETTFNNDLHTWLSTARFHRFNLTEVLKKDTTLYVYSPEQVMYFSGKIEKKNGHPMKNGELVAYHTSNDFVYNTSLTNDSAQFLIAVDDFKDGDEFYLQAINSKGKADFSNYLIDKETYPGLKNSRHFHLPISRYATSEVNISNDPNLSYTLDKNNERNYTLPNITVKARLHTEKPKETHEFYATSYINREELEKRPNRNLFDILFDMPWLIIDKGLNNNGEKKLSVMSKRGHSLLHSTGKERNEGSGGITIPLIIDGVRINDEAQYLMCLEMNTFEIESVQYLQPWQASAYTFGALDGAIIVKTRGYKEKEPLPSKGAMYSPTGLYPLSYPYKKITPPILKCSRIGNYRLIIDIITDSDIWSYEHFFTVTQ